MEEQFSIVKAAITSIQRAFSIHGFIDDNVAKVPQLLRELEYILNTVSPSIKCLDTRGINAEFHLEDGLVSLKGLIAQLATMPPLLRILRSEITCQQLCGIHLRISNALSWLRDASAGHAISVDKLCAALGEWQIVQHPSSGLFRQQLTHQDRQQSMNTVIELMQNMGIGLTQLQRDLDTILQRPDLSPQEQQVLHIMRSSCDAIQLHKMWIPPHTIQLQREPIGRGGASSVYRATAEGHGEVAVKVLQYAGDIEETEAALQEVLHSPDRTMAALRRELCVLSSGEHSFEHVCRYIGITVQQRRPAIVMEYYSKGSLASLIEASNGGLDVTTALKYSRSILRGLEELHTARFIVLDVKPANVLLTDDGTAVLADFGVSRTVRPGMSVTTLTSVQGTCEYMPPEQFKGASISAKSDIWAFGATLVHMLSGQLPFHGFNSVQIINLVANQQQHPQFPEQANYGIELRRLLEQCFQHEPERRPTAQDVLAMVKAAAIEWRDGQPPVVVTSGPPGTGTDQVIEDALQNLSSLLDCKGVPDRFYGDKLVQFAMECKDEQLSFLLGARCLLGVKLLQFINSRCADVTTTQSQTKDLFNDTSALLPKLKQAYQLQVDQHADADEKQKAADVAQEIYSAAKEVVIALDKMLKITQARDKGKVQSRREVTRVKESVHNIIKNLLNKMGLRPVPMAHYMPGATM